MTGKDSDPTSTATFCYTCLGATQVMKLFTPPGGTSKMMLVTCKVCNPPERPAKLPHS